MTLAHHNTVNEEVAGLGGLLLSPLRLGPPARLETVEIAPDFRDPSWCLAQGLFGAISLPKGLQGHRPG